MGEPLRLVPPDLTSTHEAPAPAKGPWNSEFFLRLSLTALAFFVLGLCSYLSYQWFIYAQSHIETNNAYLEADVYHVQSRMMGYTKTILAEEDMKVADQQVLLLLDDTDIHVEKGYKVAKLKKAKADFDRAVQLVHVKLISKADFEMAEAMLAAAQADVDGTNLKLKYTEILAPTEGVIAKSYVKPGQFIQPGQNLFTLISQKRFWIKANYKETQIEKLHPGQKVQIELDAYPGVKFHGAVEGIYPSSGSVVSLLPAENATGNFTKVVQRVSVKISVESQKGYLFRPGMSAVTSIEVKTH